MVPVIYQWTDQTDGWDTWWNYFPSFNDCQCYSCTWLLSSAIPSTSPHFSPNPPFQRAGNLVFCFFSYFFDLLKFERESTGRYGTVFCLKIWWQNCNWAVWMSKSWLRRMALGAASGLFFVPFSVFFEVSRCARLQTCVFPRVFVWVSTLHGYRVDTQWMIHWNVRVYGIIYKILRGVVLSLCQMHAYSPSPKFLFHFTIRLPPFSVEADAGRAGRI